MIPARRLTSGTGRLPVALLVALGLGISGCGGSQVEYQEVPGDPAEINLPDRTPAAAAGDAAEDAAAAENGAAEKTPTPAPTEAPAAEGATGATTEEGADDQTAAAEETPAATEDSAATDEPPAPGSDAERFEDFCEQNAGAC